MGGRGEAANYRRGLAGAGIPWVLWKGVMYMAIVNAHYGYCGGGKVPKFTYTGTYNVRKDGVVELLTSGTIVFLNPATIDLFLVGGGGGGMKPPSSTDDAGLPGGGGGYTRTHKNISIAKNESIAVEIGNGGLTERDGGNTVFGNYTANGGKGASINYGGAGGSGGGGGVSSNSDYGAGGSDGGNGENGAPDNYQYGGEGQGTTTREFGEPTGKMYAGGGGGGRYIYSTEPVISPGGTGGGGNGAWATGVTGKNGQPATAGLANTGGGGGGGAADGIDQPGGAGGSGIVCFRKSV